MECISCTEEICSRILNSFPGLNSFYGSLETKLHNKISKQRILFSTLLIIFGILLIFCGTFILSVTMCVLYPCVRSIKAIDARSQKEALFCLKYWLLFNSVNFLEIFLSPIISRYYSYYFLKTAFFLWCTSSNTEGANTVYGYLSSLCFEQHSAQNNMTEIQDTIVKNYLSLKVSVKNATSLSFPFDLNSLSPYCQLRLESKNNRKLTEAEKFTFETTYKEYTQNPIWCEQTVFKNLERLDLFLIATVYTKQKGKKDQKIGSVKIDLEVINPGENSPICDLEDDDEQFAGTISLNYCITEN